MSSSVHIALLMMVKNEQKRLEVSLNSIIGYVNSIVIYDTGSTDNTIDILRNFCDKYKITLRLKEGEFVDFSTSRNVSLDFADTFDDIDFLLLLDCNDELKGGQYLRPFCSHYKDKPNTGYLLCQEWWSGRRDKYYNVRMVKARQGWRYKGSVHEWINNTRFESDKAAREAGDICVKVPDTILLYQDRTQDDDKTGKRFIRDKALLLEEHKKDPTEPRTLFYLAQTCCCLNNIEEAYTFYKMRTELLGFWEERYHAYFRCGDCAELLGRPWEECMAWYIKAFEHTQRAEPMIKISEYYKDKNWLLCFTFAELACRLKYPESSILFVDKIVYEYRRWHILGIAGWYAGFYNQGKEGCLNAIKAYNLEVDKNNLTFYENKEKESR